MKDLIKALTIFSKYVAFDDYVTHCEHDVMYVNINPELVSEKDISLLDELGFHVEGDMFYSFKFGSC